MADLVIRGMEMPTDASLWILIRPDGTVHKLKVGGKHGEPQQGVAVPLPEGHGRLIDADELAEDLQLDVENYQRALDDLNIVGIERERIQFDKDCKQNCMWYLSKCPTIVPTEGGADDGT